MKIDSIEANENNILANFVCYIESQIQLIYFIRDDSGIFI